MTADAGHAEASANRMPDLPVVAPGKTQALSVPSAYFQGEAATDSKQSLQQTGDGSPHADCVVVASAAKQQQGVDNAATEPSTILCKRRAAKRESARRVRAKNKDLLCHLLEESSELEASNKVLSRDVALVDSDMVRLKEKLAASRIQTLHTQALSNQLSQELTVLQRMGVSLMHQQDHYAMKFQPAIPLGR